MVVSSTVIRATFWIVIDYGWSMGLVVGSSLILTLLLMPEWFGLMILVRILVVRISLFADIGMGAIVIQSRGEDDLVFYNIVWTVVLCRGVVFFVVCLLLGWPMLLIDGEPCFISLIPALLFGLVVVFLRTIILLLMGRKRVCGEFSLWTLIPIFSGLLSQACAHLFFGRCGRGSWDLFLAVSSRVW